MYFPEEKNQQFLSQVEKILLNSEYAGEVQSEACMLPPIGLSHPC